MLSKPLANVFEARDNLRDEWSGFQRGRERIQPLQVIIEQVQLAQLRSALRRKVSRHTSGTYLQTADPAAEAEKMDHFFVAQIEHGRFDILLCNNQFFAKSAPIQLLGQIEKLFAVPAHALLYAKSFCSTEQFAAEWFDGLDLLPFDSEEPVTDQNAKAQGKFHSVVEAKGARWTCQLRMGIGLSESKVLNNCSIEGVVY